MDKRDNLVKMTLTAMFCAIVIAMTFIPYVGYIVYGLLSITTLHVVVILGAVILGPARGSVIGLVWGVTCLIYAMMNGTTDAAIFLDPRISVIPRILVGFAAGWYYRGFRALFTKLFAKHSTKPTVEQKDVRNTKRLKGKGASVAAATVTGILGTMTNTVLVLTAISLFGGSGMLKLNMVLTTIVQTALALNGVVELGLAIVVIPAVSVPLLAYLRKNGTTR